MKNNQSQDVPHLKAKSSSRSIRNLLFAFSLAILIYVACMAYFYFNPVLGYTVFMPMNAPSLLQPKDQTIQVHTDVMPVVGLTGAELLLIPANSSAVYASLEGGSLVESKKAGAGPECKNFALSTCEKLVTPGGMNYEYVVEKDGVKITAKRIYFSKNQTNIAISLWSDDTLALGKEMIDKYIDSFQQASTSDFKIDHLILAP